ncbi:MAG: biotin--[Bacteroidales bacterium]|nr:biotin--[acetyl-CoA-carboxylase] ligase [Bacteroidales bacterium]
MRMAEKYQVRWFEVTDSTNNRLLADRGGLPSGTVYAALFQTAGRGQRGNSWKSASGQNLMFSLLLKPVSLPAGEQFAISEAVTLGITDYLLAKGVEARIKWPNDIYCGDRKICGMLVENSVSGDKVADSVVGIGLNLNQKEFDPSAPNPTSLSLLTGISYSLEEELQQLLGCLFGRCKALEESADGEAQLEKEYLSRLYRLGEWHRFIDCRASGDNLTPTTVAIDGETFTGRIIGLAPGGLLRIERLAEGKKEGEAIDFAFKELRYII